MPWPPSLLGVQNKEESEAEVTRDSVADKGRVGTLEGSSLLITALQSFSQAQMHDGKQIAEEIHAFFGPIEGEKSSLVSTITSLDAQLAAARDRILRVCA